MNVADMMTAEAPAAAVGWLQRELAAAESRHGREWPKHRAWVEEYLRTELRQALAGRMEATPE